jgi:phosphoadenosine phosphosulfate reductase
MLIEKTLFGERNKVEMAIARLKLHEPKEGYYVAFSGGKDSCVVLDLCKRAGVKYDAHYNLTTVDPPELVRFIKKYHPDIWETRTKPKKSMWQLIEEKQILPTRVFRYCCAVLKEGGAEGEQLLRALDGKNQANEQNEKCVKLATTTKTNSSCTRLLIGRKQKCGNIYGHTMSHTVNYMTKDSKGLGV